MHGGTGPWWAVWVEMATTEQLPPAGTSPVLAELRALGYATAGTPVRCVVGTHEALDLDPAADLWGWPVYFRSAEDAEAFVTSWDRPVAGVVPGADLSCDWG